VSGLIETAFGVDADRYAIAAALLVLAMEVLLVSSALNDEPRRLAVRSTTHAREQTPELRQCGL